MSVHRRDILEGIRFAALDPADQLALCPPYAVVPQLIEEIIGTLEHAKAVQRDLGTVAFSPHEYEQLRPFAGLIEKALANSWDVDDWVKHATSSFDWAALRSAARRLLAHNGWIREIDATLFRYLDPITGKTVTPSLRPRERGEPESGEMNP